MRSTGLSKFLTAVYVICLALAAGGTALLRLTPIDLRSYPSLVETFADFCKQYSWAVVVLPVLAGAAKAGAERLRANWLKHVVQSTLTQMADQMFGRHGGATDEHRATLFVHRKFAFWGTFPWKLHRHPWSGWLVPVVRSGHTTQKVRSCFLAPDRAANSEGVAGLVWRKKMTVTVQDLDAITSQSPSSDVSTYISRSLCPEAWVELRLRNGDAVPRALRGIPVEVDNNLWGVIVLDSKHPQPFDADPSGSGDLTRMFSFTLSKLLERARV